MMASHRPSDPPPDLPAEPTAEATIGQPAVPAPPPNAPRPSALEPSAFLAGFDHVLAIGVLALGFLLASFAIRNSDFYMHLAAGRLLVDGGYSFGKDPFSYVDPERTWVNHAWLFDGLLYLLYNAGGPNAVVIAKAFVVTVIAGLLLLTRKAGHALWPGVVCVGLGLLAAAPRLNLQPVMASYLGFTLLLFLLMRMPRPEGSWRFPIIVGVLCWFWANCDQWFFLGPVTLLLYTLGQYIRREEGEHINQLWKALGIGVIACMLNPHHVRVWTLPPELVNGSLAKLVADDVDYGPVFQDAFGKGAIDLGIGAERDNPANTYSLILVVLLTLAGFGVNFRRLSVGLVLIWAALLVLFLFHLRASPFLALASGAIAATNLAAWGQRLLGHTLSDGLVRVLHMLRAMGRGLTALVGVLLIALSYPGWLHPLSQQRRWSWEEEPNTSMVNTALKLHEWRTAGLLPAEARLLNVQPDFANYVAWYAPGEKTFCDFRYGFHEPELAEYIDLRKHLGPGMDAVKLAKLNFDFPAFLRKHGIVYAVTAHQSRSRNMAVLVGLWTPPANRTEADWSIWHIDGRGVILGWDRQTVVPASKLQALRYDPVKLAYAAETTPLKKVANPRAPFTERDIWDRYVTPPPLVPSAGEEVLILQDYRQRLIQRTMQTMATEVDRKMFNGWGVFQLSIYALGKNLGPTPAVRGLLNLRPESLVDIHINRTLDDRLPADVNALAILGIRAARRAVLESPDHPDGYYFLAKAYQMAKALDITGLAPPTSSSSLARYTARIPLDPQQRRSTLPVFLSAFELQQIHQSANPPRLDMATTATDLGALYLGHELELREAALDRLSEAEQRETESMRKQHTLIEKGLQSMKDELQKRRDQFINDAARTSVAVERAALASRRYGLAQEALDELLKEIERSGASQADSSKAFTVKERAEIFATRLDLAELLLHAGRAEDANDILESMDNTSIQDELQTRELRTAYFNVRRAIAERLRAPMSPLDANPAAHYRQLRHLTALVMGDFEKVKDLLTQSLSAIQQNFNDYRQMVLTKMTKDAPKDYSHDQLHKQLMLLTSVAPILEAHAFATVSSGMEGPVVAMTIANQLLFGYFDQLREFGNAHLRLALMFLEEGDMKAARFHLLEADKLPKLPAESPTLKLAKAYLDAIPK